MKPLLLALMIFPAITLAGCLEPGEPGVEKGGPTRHAPEFSVVPLPDDSGDGGGDGAPRPPPEWFVWIEVLEQTLPAQDAVLELAIRVEDQGVATPFDGEGWILRLSVNDEHTLHNGTVEPPDDADWYRNYTLASAPNATTVHPVPFSLGDLDGDQLVLRLDYHNLFPDGHWDAMASIIFIDQDDDGGYVPRNKERAYLHICHSAVKETVCPWYEEHGYGPPPDG